MARRIKSLLFGSLSNNSANSLSTLKATTAVFCGLRSGLMGLRDTGDSCVDQLLLFYGRMMLRSTFLPFCVAENAVKNDIQNVVRLLLDARSLTEEVVGEHGAVQEIADNVGNALDGHVAEAASLNQRAIQLLPALDIGLAVNEISRLFPVFELGAFLNQQLHVLRVFGKEIQKGPDAHSHTLKRILNALDA